MNNLSSSSQIDDLSINESLSRMIIPKYIPPRTNDIPITNCYSVYNNQYKDDFHIAIYYKEPQKIKIIVRRVDEAKGWGQNLKIQLFSVDGTQNEIIFIGSCNQNSKMIDDKSTNITIQPAFIDPIQKIPRIIVQTANSRNCSNNLLLYNSIMTFLELNPEYEYYLFDADDRREFIRENMPDQIFSAYETLIPGAYQAAIFRYCFLYSIGGCYFDCKTILYHPLRRFINPQDNMIICNDGLKESYSNAIMLMCSNNSRLLEMIHRAAENVNNKIYRIGINDACLSIVGTKLYYEYFHQIPPKIFFIIPNDNKKVNEYIYLHNNIHSLRLMKKQYNGYYKKNNYNMKTFYADRYNMRTVYQNPVQYPPINADILKPIKNNFLLIKNKYLPDKFSVKIYSVNHSNYAKNTIHIHIRRTDQNSGWGMNLILRIYSMDYSKYQDIPISNSHINECRYEVKINKFVVHF
jgi:mannosyltransferase OCH1-like enzyme